MANVGEDYEPLGYQHFLYDVNIEYSPGGNRSQSISNKHCFKLKYLPYMVPKEENGQQSRKNSLTSSDRSICDQNSIQDDESIISIDQRHIDVTKATCAFLSNSDFVPSNQFGGRRIVLELISAKLSQSTTFNVSSNTGLIILPKQSTNSSINNRSLGNVYENEVSRNSLLTFHGTNQSTLTTSAPSANSSKRFVNYTILIKTAPGLDKHPAVIERRFSDFEALYKGLKCHDSMSKIVDKHVTFPKKVYMGNFSLTNIAERSIEFARLLNLCITNYSFLYSEPFISFLLDKELKEAHKLSLCGDPDDVQAIIETVHYIEQKLYLNESKKRMSNNSSPSISSENYGSINNSCSPLPNGGSMILNSSSTMETISSDGCNPMPSSSQASSSPLFSTYDISEESDSLPQNKAILPALNQRILVTFCMLLLTYYRGENYRELKTVVQEFSQLISSQEYIDSIINTRHYITLRACLLFMMNMNEGDIIDDSQRRWLKQRLEDVDGAHAELDTSSNNHTKNVSMESSPVDWRKRRPNSDTSISSNSRITRGDLTSILRDRNFCTF